MITFVPIDQVLIQARQGQQNIHRCRQFLSKLGGEVQASPLSDPIFSPDGPPVTVPVLGCSSLKESYLSLANQPSSGAIQGDVKLVSERNCLHLWMFCCPCLAWINT